MAIFCYSVDMIVKFYQYIQDCMHTELFIDFMSLLLLLPCIFAIVEYIYIKKWKKEKDGKVYFIMHSDIILLVFVSVQFFFVKPDKLPIVFALAGVAKIIYICIAILLKRAKIGEKKLSNKKHKKLQETEQEEYLLQQEQQQEIIEEPISLEKDVHIDHIYKTLESLRRQKLTTGDRLECKKIEEILRLYNMKKELTVVETSLLNDILASLLKMMAKYTV